MKTYLILDASNLIHRVFRAHIKDKEDILSGMCIHSVINTLNKYYNKHKPDDIVVAFDSTVRSWRKKYTDSPDCKSYKKYKGNRRQNLSESDLKKYEQLDKLILDIKDMLINQSSLIILEADELEADDLIAGFVQVNDSNKCIIISGDEDFIQLLQHPNTELISPMQDKHQSLEEWEHDAGLFMFEKCIRGDAGDNVMSSYPRLRKDKIVAAYKNEFNKQNIMNNKFNVDFYSEDGTLQTKEFITEEIFKENQLLMDLSKQPNVIKKRMYTTILSAMDNRGKFSIFSFLKFCGRYDLKNIASNVSNYSKMFSLKSGS
jgi:hypothetical protein